MAEKKSGGGSKLARTQTVTVRFDPKLRYLAELAARKQRRTVSSFIEWVVQESLNDVYLNELTRVTVANESNFLWDVDDSERFIRLALAYPALLTHEEQLLWRVLKDHDLLELYGPGSDGSAEERLHSMRERHLPFIQQYWDKLVARSQGENVDIPEFDPIPF